MADEANNPRLATARALDAQVNALSKMAGLYVKAIRAHTKSYTQEDVAARASTTQGKISDLEQAKVIPDTPTIEKIMKESGFDMNAPGSKSLLALFELLRDHREGFEKLADEKP